MNTKLLYLNTFNRDFVINPNKINVYSKKLYKKIKKSSTWKSLNL